MPELGRPVVYPLQVPYDTDVLQAALIGYVNIGKLAQALFGGEVVLRGFAATQTAVPSLAVLIAPGEIYDLKPIDDTPYSSIAINTTPMQKVGINQDAGTFPTPAPLTIGDSINYLIQMQLTTVDNNVVNRPYFNSSNPASPIYQFITTMRRDFCNIEVKIGTPAPTGSQVTPTPDAGFTGVWVVTVAYGQTTVTAPDITMYPGAPFISPIFPAPPTPPPPDNPWTGATMWSWSSVPNVGWIRVVNSGSIGNAASGATLRANADALNLFTALWAGTNTDFPVSGGRGGSALADFNANKTLSFPSDVEQRVPGILGSAGTIGSRFGSDSVSLTAAQNGLHVHGVPQLTHTHGINDPTHAHTINDPGHNHTLNNAASIVRRNNAAPDSMQASPDDLHTDNVTITANAASTGISINASATGITVDAAYANIPGDETGASGFGAAHENRQPTILMYLFTRL